MWVTEVILRRRRDAFDGRAETVSIGGTSAPDAIRAVADQLVREAMDEERMWQGVDETLGVMAEAERVRLERVIEAVVADAEPELHVVPDHGHLPGHEVDPGEGGR